MKGLAFILPGLLGWLPALSGCNASATLYGTETREYEVHFEGNDSVSEHRLLAMIQLDLDDFDRSGHRAAYIDDAAYDLEIGYRSLGFPFTTASYEVAGEPPASEVRFVISEGPRTVLDGAQFIGMERLTDANFDSNLASRRTAALVGARPYYVESDIEGALSAMEREYVELGHLDVKIDLLRTDFNEDRSEARIVVNVQEGRAYRIDDIQVLCDSLSAEQIDAYERKLEETDALAERVWRARTGYELRGMLVEALSSEGFADATIAYEHTLNTDDATVSLTYELSLGPQVRIRQILFPEGLQTKASFIRSRVKLQAGDIYDSKKVRESVRTLYDTGLFKRVSIELDEGTGTERDLLVEFVEAPSGEVFVEPGYGSYERARLRVGFREKNLWGSGRLLRVESTVSDRAQRGTVSITDPWFLGSRFSADFALRYDRRELPSFTDESQSAGVFWTRDWAAQHTTSFGYQFRRSQVSDVIVTDTTTPNPEDEINISSIQATQRFDTRDNLFLPGNGWFNEVAVEYGDEALSSELDFLRTYLRLSAFTIPYGRTVLAGAFRTGIIQPTQGKSSIPLQERYFNGGQTSVRSFRFGELGPKDADGNPLGGETYTTANIELRQPLSARIQGALFLDAGNVTQRHHDYLDFAGVELGVGLGLRYLLPIGPVRLDVGFNPDPDMGDPDYVVHFSIGMAF
ncbi:MAG: outer membrane protein insertion porin family [Chlamydiales bacterium]|jgi:outer membrane protein insertion porin family